MKELENVSISMCFLQVLANFYKIGSINSYVPKVTSVWTSHKISMYPKYEKNFKQVNKCAIVGKATTSRA